MKNKTLILAIILVMLVALAYAYQGPIKTWRDNMSRPKNFLAGLDTARLDRIIVAKNGETTLEKAGEDWLVKGTKFKVSKLEMSEALEALDRASKTSFEFASTNKDKKKDFGTDPSTSSGQGGGVTVRLYAGDQEVVTFTIGRLASDYESSFVSEPQIDSTYILKRVNLTYVFDKDDWRDRMIFASEAAKINKLRFQFPDRQFTIAKNGDKWFGEGRVKLALDKTKVDKALDLMANLSAVSIPAQDFRPTGFDKNLMIVEATGDGLKNTLMVGNDDGKGNFYAKSGASDNIYLISKDDREKLNKKLDQLK